MSRAPEPLPIDEVLPAVVGALQAHPCAVLQAPTGAGKTTRIPPALLDAGLAGEHMLVMLEPRRLAARAAARRIAQERDQRLGAEVGYQVRLERVAGKDTRILVVTEGVLVRMLQADPYLEHVGVLVFDEFHERSLDADLALAMARRVQLEVRQDLKILVMSATLAGPAVARFLGDAPLIESSGRSYPVEIRYSDAARQQDRKAALLDAIGQAWSQTSADILVFLPGRGEIAQTRRELEAQSYLRGAVVLELYGDLPLEDQDRVLRRGATRRVVLATNVAQTSITVDGVTAVIDTGLARMSRFDPGAGLDRLELTRIARSSADQRAGRAGRLEPGVCWRLWSMAEQRSMPEFEEPEIRRVDLAGAVLQLAAWGETNFERFGWFEAPQKAHLERARESLRSLGALRSAGEAGSDAPTELGRAMVELPLAPRLARLVLAGAELGGLGVVALAAALLGERSPFRSDRSAKLHAASSAGPSHATTCDVYDRVVALEDFEAKGWVDSHVGRLDPAAARSILALAARLIALVGGRDRQPKARRDEILRRALLVAWSDRLARRREPGSERALLIDGRGAVQTAQSAVRDSEWFVCVDIEAGQRSERAQALVRLASAIEPDWIEPHLWRTETVVEFDAQAERVRAKRRRLVGQILVEEALVPLPDDGQVAVVLLAAARSDPMRALGLDRAAPARFLARVRFLAGACPELELPRFEGDELQAVLADVASQRTSLQELREAPVLDWLRARLSQTQLRALDVQAPDWVEVPSGSKLELDYQSGRAPVLAVRIQEIFGWQAAPAVAGGRVKLLLHLLGPNYRPQQITDDLASFWKNTYPEVRKELKRRYPKHSWPEDPLSARPERKGSSRRM